MNVNILTSGYWPTYPVVDANLPAELNTYQQVHFVLRHDRGTPAAVGCIADPFSDCATHWSCASAGSCRFGAAKFRRPHLQVFKEFYLSKHSGRRLVWHNSLGTCILKARFDKGTKELSVSLFQVRVYTSPVKHRGDHDCIDLRCSSGCMIQDIHSRQSMQTHTSACLYMLGRLHAGPRAAGGADAVQRRGDAVLCRHQGGAGRREPGAAAHAAVPCLRQGREACFPVLQASGACLCASVASRRRRRSTEDQALPAVIEMARAVPTATTP